MSDYQMMMNDRAEGFATAADMIGKLLRAWEEDESLVAQLRDELLEARAVGGIDRETYEAVVYERDTLFARSAALEAALRDLVKLENEAIGGIVLRHVMDFKPLFEVARSLLRNTPEGQP